MHEPDLRRLIRADVRSRNSASLPVLIDELPILDGNARVDLVSVNGLLTAYELKSAADRLVRLPHQINAIDHVFDRCRLAVAEQHVEAAKSIVPDWWGIDVVRTAELRSSRVIRIRGAHPNPSLDPAAIAALLWRPELMRLLHRNGYRAASRETHARLVAWVVHEIPLGELRREVRTALKRRYRSRTRSRQRRGGGLARPVPRTSGFLARRIR